MGIIEIFEDIIEVQELLEFLPRHEKHVKYIILEGKFLDVHTANKHRFFYDIICLVPEMEDTYECTEEQLIYIINTHFRKA